MRKWAKGIGIGLVAVALSTLGISASDSLRGVSGSLLSLVIKHDILQGCGADSVELESGDKRLCVDRFEASPGLSCDSKDPKTLQESERDLSSGSCAPASQKDATPWRFINLSQAQRACAAAGKRLLSNSEWYRAALGTNPDTSDCFLHGGGVGPRVSSESTCKSTAGAYDMVGNVWEWVDAQSSSGNYDTRKLPDTGYVSGVDANGIALSTKAEGGDSVYGEDYFWQSGDGTKGMIRGGYYDSEKDGGLYALNAAVDLGFGSAGVGFRCVRDYPH